jgi:hypothetical protein
MESNACLAEQLVMPNIIDNRAESCHIIGRSRDTEDRSRGSRGLLLSPFFM